MIELELTRVDLGRFLNQDEIDSYNNLSKSLLFIHNVAKTARIMGVSKNTGDMLAEVLSDEMARIKSEMDKLKNKALKRKIIHEYKKEYGIEWKHFLNG